MKLRAFVLPPLLLYAIYAGVMFGAQAKMLFPGSSTQLHPFHAPLPVGSELVEIPASFGKIRAVYWRGSSGAAGRPALLYMHGNFERVEDSFAVLQPLVHRGIPVLQLEFPGYDGADGGPTFDSINEAANAAFDWLAKRPEIDRHQILAMGYSVGGGAASELTRHRPVRALILLSTFSSIADIARSYAIPKFLVRFPYDNVARVREFAGPVFVEHGLRDEVISYAFGHQVAEAAQHGNFISLDCGHANCQFDHNIFAERLPRWLAANGIVDEGRRR